MAGAVDIPAAKLIGSLPVVAAQTVNGVALGKVGVFSNLRYIRVSIVSTAFAASGATIAVHVIKHSEIIPS